MPASDFRRSAIHFYKLLFYMEKLKHAFGRPTLHPTFDLGIPRNASALVARMIRASVLGVTA
jgi:hypothetical protein